MTTKKWTKFSESLPDVGKNVEVKFSGGVVSALTENAHFVFPNVTMKTAALVESGEKWRYAPKEDSRDEIERNDSKTIPNGLLLSWLIEKFSEYYGTVANDIETNVDKIIVRYNAGTVKK